MGHTCVKPDTMRKLYLPVGMIGSGKSTWGRAQKGVKIVAGDDVRYMLHGGEYVHDEALEPAVIEMLIRSAQVLLVRGHSVILDECYCGLTREMRAATAAHFKDMAVEIIAVVFPEIDMQDRIEDKKLKGLRGKTVGYWKQVFTEMAKIYEPVDLRAEKWFTKVIQIGA
jgi:predicted kinase